MELLDVINENNELTGEVLDKEIIHKKGIFHKEVVVWIMNKQGEILLQKRATTKKHNPNKWGLTAGHVDDNYTFSKREYMPEMIEYLYKEKEDIKK